MKFFAAVGTLVALIGALPAAAFADWEVEPSHTHIGFHVLHLGLTHTPGWFRKFDAKLKFNGNEIQASSVSFTIEAASVDTANDQRDAALRGADWLDADQYPNITFVSTSVRRVDDMHYVISGKLNIRGKSLPVDFNATLTNRVTNPFLKVPAVGFSANTQIKRSTFGLVKFIPAVSDDVELEIQTELNQKP